MTTFNKHELLTYLAQQARQQLTIIVTDYRDLPAGQLNYSPAADQWSMAQCFKHLNTYSEYYLPFMESALKINAKPTHDFTFKSNWLGDLFVRMMENKTPLKKFKAIHRHTPPVNLDARHEVNAFIRYQQQLISLIERSKSADLARIRIPLSLNRFLKISLGDGMRFQVAHTQRHLAQISRLNQLCVQNS